MQFIDRKAKYPGRWTMKKSDGSSEIITLVRNDEPIVEGTPLNANTLNALGGTDTTLSVEGMAADAAKVGEAINAESERAKGVESQLKEDLDYLSTKKISSEDTSFFEHSINLFDYTDRDRVIDNAYMDKGVVTEYNGWSCTEYIRVEPNTEYAVVRCYASSTGWDYTRDNYCDEFDIYKKYIRTFNTKAPFTTSENCYYIRLSARYLYGTVNLTGRMVSKYVDIESFLGSMDASLYVPEYHNIVADNVSNMESKVSNMELSAITKSSGIAYVLRKNEIPSYYTESPSEPTSFEDIEYLERKIKNVPDGKHFVFITDPHWPSNRKNSPALISYIMNRLDIDTVIMGGDILDRSDTKYKGAAELLSYTAIMKSAIGKKYFPVLGNHDINTANTGGYTPEQLEPLIIPYDIVLKNIFPPYIEPDEATKLDSLGLDKETILDLHAYMKCHYHYDDFKNKIRYINIVTGTTNPGNPKTIFGLSNYSELLLQFDWLYDVLMNIPDGFDVVLCGHALVSWGSTASAESDQVKSYALYVMQMLSALKTKGACTVTNDKDNAKLNLYFSAGDHNYDFSNAPNVGTILALGGDTHWDCQCVCHNKSGTYISETISDSTVYQDDSVIAIVTQTDSQGKSSYSGKDYAEKVHKMTSGTVSEQCFDIVTIGDGITFTRIGAGNDRYFDYN